jgi:hypothetical protein
LALAGYEAVMLDRMMFSIMPWVPKVSVKLREMIVARTPVYPVTLDHHYLAHQDQRLAVRG